MVKDLHYIIKRILIGVGIALVLAFLKGGLILNTYALEVSNYGIGNTEAVIDNTTQFYQKNITGNPWSTFAGMSGYVSGSFALQKINGTSTSINVFPSQIFISTNTGYQDYICDIGTAMEGNSTFNGGTFTYRCPIKMGTNGVTRLVFQFQNIQTNFPSEYRLSIGSGMSFEVIEDTNVNVDTSGTTNAINNQTQSNNHNRDANFGNLINDNRDNTQDIIDNQNNNTQQQIESQKVCELIDKSNIKTDNKYLNSSGGEAVPQENNWGITDYFKINASTIKSVSVSSSANGFLCFYNVNKSVISCIGNNTLTENSIITIPSNASYVRFTINKNMNKPQFNVCRNGNQAIVDSQHDINNTLNDTSGGEVSSSWFDEFKDSSSTPVSDLLTMPITLLQAYLNGFSGNCQAMNLGQLYGTYIIIPCINIESYIGHELWSLIDVIFTLFMLYNIGMLCVTIYEGITSLNDDMQFLYSPRHAGAGDTRVERYGDDY